MSKEQVTVADGKYTVINDNGILTALRHGEPWGRNLLGDNLVYWMMVRILELEAKIMDTPTRAELANRIAKSFAELGLLRLQFIGKDDDACEVLSATRGLLNDLDKTLAAAPAPHQDQQALLEAAPASRVLFEAIKHGDEAHREWLRDALDAWFAGRPVPPCNQPTAQQPSQAPAGHRLVPDAHLRECRHCGFLNVPNDRASKDWYPLSQPKPGATQ